MYEGNRLPDEVRTAEQYFAYAALEDIVLYEHLLEVGPVVREDRLQP